MSERNSTQNSQVTPPVHVGNQSEAVPYTSRQEASGQHHIQDDSTESPLSFSPETEKDLTREELLTKINECSSWLREYASCRTDKTKGKQKAHINSILKSNQKKVSRLHQRILEHMLMIMERCNARGFVYGIVTENSKAVIGASDSLRAWWKRQIMFDKVGPTQTDLYYKENSVLTNTCQDNEAKSTTELLMELSDTTLGSILSLLMQRCDPPQKKFPFGKGMQPPWWPTANEGWWGQTGIARDKGPPPFRKPHDLRKKWKVVVLIGIIKHMAPYFSRPFNQVQQSHHLKLRMNAKEKKFWTLALVSEAKHYCQEHPHMAVDEPIAFLQAYGGNAFQIARNVRRQNVTISANEAALVGNPVGFMQRPLFAPRSSTASAWAVTAPTMGQLQQGAQIAPRYLPWASSSNPTFPTNLPSEVQQNYTVEAFGASSTGLPDHQAQAIQFLQFVAQPGAGFTSGTPNPQNQTHGEN